MLVCRVATRPAMFLHYAWGFRIQRCLWQTIRRRLIRKSKFLPSPMLTGCTKRNLQQRYSAEPWPCAVRTLIRHVRFAVNGKRTCSPCVDKVARLVVACWLSKLCDSIAKRLSRGNGSRFATCLFRLFSCSRGVLLLPEEIYLRRSWLRRSGRRRHSHGRQKRWVRL
ncbi:uncharacterized protein BKA78DRAFT_46762 [Phyllosticta capitalensis]|uniref:uncharacterized protein n=1 Tax=Phyllosticta capitalensis TaxID=121624 RepID=UPI00313277EE